MGKTRIANCWKLNEKNEESRNKNEQYSRDFQMTADDDMVAHFEILDKETKLIMEWTTLGNGKILWAWSGATENEKGEVLENPTSKYDALAIVMANGS